jgi:hypothetical protein
LEAELRRRYPIRLPAERMHPAVGA